MRTRHPHAINQAKKQAILHALTRSDDERSAKSFHRRGALRWRQSFASARLSKFHFIDAAAFAPHHLRIE
jgi:hypothetical protein